MNRLLEKSKVEVVGGRWSQEVLLNNKILDGYLAYCSSLYSDNV